MTWVLAGLAALVVGVWLARRAGQVDRAEAHRLVEAGAQLVDVRTPEEFEGGHLSAARNLPLREFAARMAELEPKDGPLVLYCASGTRSAVARSILRRAGFTKVFDLGPMRRW